MSGLRARLRLLGVTAGLPWLLAGCGLGCADEVVQHEPSPYGRGAAVVFVRNCGATTAYATQVALIGHVDADPGDRNVFFVADGNHGAAPEGPGGGPRVRVRWVDGTHLEVGYHPRARTFRKEAKHGPVTITYVPLP